MAVEKLTFIGANGMPNDEGPAKRGALLTDVGIPMVVVESVCAD
jgi:hypothetical protein